MDARKRGPRTKHAAVGPSRKRTRNSNITDLSQLLHTPEEIDRFRTFYSDKRLIIPKYGTLDSFSDFKFPALLKAQHVEEFIGYKGPVYPDLVRFFYCNLMQEGKLLVSRVKGKIIRLNTKTIGEILNIPFNGENFCPNQLCEWGDISKYDAYVSLCRFDRRTMEQKRAQAGRQLNWAFFVKSIMFGSREAIGLPYAKEVSQILEHFGVDFSDEVMFTPTKENMLDLGVLPSMRIIWNEELEAFVHKGDHGQPSDDAPEDNAGPSNAAAQGDENGEETNTSQILIPLNAVSIAAEPVTLSNPSPSLSESSPSLSESSPSPSRTCHLHSQSRRSVSPSRSHLWSILNNAASMLSNNEETSVEHDNSLNIVDTAQFSLQILDGSFYCLKTLDGEGGIVSGILSAIFVIEWGCNISKALDDSFDDKSMNRIKAMLSFGEYVCAFLNKINVQFFKSLCVDNCMRLLNILIQSVKSAIFVEDRRVNYRITSLCCTRVLEVLERVCVDENDEQNLLHQLLSKDETWHVFVVQKFSSTKASGHQKFVALIDKLIQKNWNS
ncbi:uncharacterized protein [Cicer arietinum]|uniref:E3 ubiquitin-protein ligase listerin n=1 Tax=Cicer arietinum TaxID=3827 RepID=A0A3Q7XRF7_CICAR|nr:uncharacterized protein LOC113784405 [Cicer arietinum]